MGTLDELKTACKSEILDLLVRLETEIKLVKSDDYQTAYEAQKFKTIFDGLRQLMEIVGEQRNKTSVNWLSWLDIRKSYTGNMAFLLEAEYKLTKAKNFQASENRSSKKKKEADEFETFEADSTYDEDEDLPSIFCNTDFSERRYRNLSELFKKYFCRESFICETDPSIESLEPFVFLNKHLL